jgi:transcriptional regulator with XRE-family HTH domain
LNSTTRNKPRATLGGLLRHWRTSAKMSQLDLALELGVSTRHLSYLESDKARPSETMLQAISIALAIPRSERNTLRLAAGFKPRLDAAPQPAAERGRVREVVEQVKRAHRDIPLLVKDQIWDIVDANEPARELFSALIGRELVAGLGYINVLELVFAPGYLREHLANWDDVADATVRRLRHETGIATDNPAFEAVLDRVADMPGFASRWGSPGMGQADIYSTRYIFDLPEGRRAFDSILISLGAPYEAVLNGIRFDTFHAVEP